MNIPARRWSNPPSQFFTMPVPLTQQVREAGADVLRAAKQNEPLDDIAEQVLRAMIRAADGR